MRQNLAKFPYRGAHKEAKKKRWGSREREDCSTILQQQKQERSKFPTSLLSEIEGT